MQLSKVQHQDIISLIKGLGDYAVSMQPKVMADASLVDTKKDDSLVTVVDKEISTKLINGLQAITPNVTVLSEEVKGQLEQIQKAAASKQPIWVVDPLDGTASYTDGYKEYAVNVGLLEPDAYGEMKPTVGFVYFPGQDLFLYTDPQGKAVVWNTNTDSKQKCSPLLAATTVPNVAIGWRAGDDSSKSPLAGIGAAEEKYTGPFRAAKVILGECAASVMNGGVSIWDTAGIEAVANAVGLSFMPFDDVAKSFDSRGMYYGGDVSHYYKQIPLANPPYVCASPSVLKSLAIDAPAYAQASRGR